MCGLSAAQGSKDPVVMKNRVKNGSMISADDGDLKKIDKSNSRKTTPKSSGGGKKAKCGNVLLIIFGALTGAINGLFGGGGGMIVVPLLMSAAGHTRKQAHSASILIMLPISFISAVVYALNGEVDINLVLPVTIGFTVGGVAGALLLNKLSDTFLKYIFTALIVAAGIKLLFF